MTTTAAWHGNWGHVDWKGGAGSGCTEFHSHLLERHAIREYVRKIISENDWHDHGL